MILVKVIGMVEIDNFILFFEIMISLLKWKGLLIEI